MATDPHPDDYQEAERLTADLEADAAAEAFAADAAAHAPADAEVTAIDQVRGELTELKDKYLRLMAEFDNFRKRTARERIQERASAAESTIRTILPAVDDFDRAKATADNPANDEAFSVGVEMVYSKLKRSLESLGVKAMESTGQNFDADLHEAFTEIPAASPELAGKVVDTIEPGYFLNDKLIRHAKVVIGK